MNKTIGREKITNSGICQAFIFEKVFENNVFTIHTAKDILLSVKGKDNDMIHLNFKPCLFKNLPNLYDKEHNGKSWKCADFIAERNGSRYRFTVAEYPLEEELFDIDKSDYRGDGAVYDMNRRVDEGIAYYLENDEPIVNAMDNYLEDEDKVWLAD